MTTPNPKSQPELIRVGRPARRGTLTFEPATPFDGPVTDGPLIRVGNPVRRGKLVFERLEPVYLELTLTLRPDTDATAVAMVFAKLTAFVDLLNCYEAELGGVGFAVDAARSGPRSGPTIALVLIPNDLTGADRRLSRVAELLAKAASEYTGKVGVIAGVFSVAEPDQPLFSIAA